MTDYLHEVQYIFHVKIQLQSLTRIRIRIKTYVDPQHWLSNELIIWMSLYPGRRDEGWADGRASAAALCWRDCAPRSVSCTEWLQLQQGVGSLPSEIGSPKIVLVSICCCKMEPMSIWLSWASVSSNYLYCTVRIYARQKIGPVNQLRLRGSSGSITSLS